MVLRLNINSAINYLICLFVFQIYCYFTFVGCPFRHSDPELLKQKLQFYKVPPSGISQVGSVPLAIVDKLICLWYLLCYICPLISWIMAHINWFLSKVIKKLANGTTQQAISGREQLVRLIMGYLKFLQYIKGRTLRECVTLPKSNKTHRKWKQISTVFGNTVFQFSFACHTLLYNATL